MTTFMNNLPELILQDWISPSANSSWCSSERKTCKSIKKREEKIFENPINIHYPNRLNIDTNLINRIFFFQYWIGSIIYIVRIICVEIGLFKQNSYKNENIVWIDCFHHIILFIFHCFRKKTFVECDSWSPSLKCLIFWPT